MTKNLRNVVIVLAIAAVVVIVPGGGTGANVVSQVVSLAFLASLVWFASVMYRQHRSTLYSLGDGPDGGLYYDAHPIDQMRYELTMLAYDMNGAPLSYGHGAPRRLRNEVQLGFKQVKWIAGIEFVAHFSEVGGG